MRPRCGMGAVFVATRARLGHTLRIMEDAKNTTWLSPRDRRRLAVVAGVWALLIGAYAAFLHAVFRSSALDLALHTQLLWNAVHGHGLVSSLLAGSDDFLARHIRSEERRVGKE